LSGPEFDDGAPTFSLAAGFVATQHLLDGIGTREEQRLAFDRVSAACACVIGGEVDAIERIRVELLVRW